MLESVKIGLFLNDDKVTLVESDHNKPQKIVSATVTSSTDTPFPSDLSEEIPFVALLQKLLRDNKINPGPAGISIPAKEVLLRTFVLPWMSSTEANQAIAFEAKKYVPFDLSDLSYTYHSMTWVENNRKLLWVIFYAIRKQTLEKYDRLLKQIGCKPTLYEPSPVSLAKELIIKKHLRLSQKTIAVIHVHEQYGQIIFYEKGIAYFLREFTLPLSTGNKPQSIDTYLVNEASKSFDYYSRQFSKQKAEEVLLFLTTPDRKLAAILAQELSVKVKMVEPITMVGSQRLTGLDSFYACGVSLKNSPLRSVSFNFLKDKSFESASLVSWNIVELVPALKTAVISILVLAVIFMGGQWQLKGNEKQLHSLFLNQGALASVPVDQIQAQMGQNQVKLDEYKKIPVRTHLTPSLIRITRALPSGVWLKALRIHYNSAGQIVLNLDGYVSSQDFNAQVKIVNEVLSNLKVDKVLSLSNLQITMTQKEIVNNHAVLYFRMESS